MKGFWQVRTGLLVQAVGGAEFLAGKDRHLPGSATCVLTEEKKDLVVICVTAEEHEAALGQPGLGGKLLLGPVEPHRAVHLAVQQLLHARPDQL